MLFFLEFTMVARMAMVFVIIISMVRRWDRAWNCLQGEGLILPRVKGFAFWEVCTVQV